MNQDLMLNIKTILHNVCMSFFNEKLSKLLPTQSVNENDMANQGWRKFETVNQISKKIKKKSIRSPERLSAYTPMYTLTRVKTQSKATCGVTRTNGD